MKKHILLPVLLSTSMMAAQAAVEVPLEAIYQEEIMNDEDSSAVSSDMASSEAVVSSSDASQPIPIISVPEHKATPVEAPKQKSVKTSALSSENQQKVRLLLVRLQNYLEEYLEKVETQHKIAKKQSAEKLAQNQTSPAMPAQPPSQQQAGVGGVTPPQKPIILPSEPIPANQEAEVGGVTAPQNPSTFPSAPIPDYGSQVPPPSTEQQINQPAQAPASVVALPAQQPQAGPVAIQPSAAQPVVTQPVTGSVPQPVQTQPQPGLVQPGQVPPGQPTSPTTSVSSPQPQPALPANTVNPAAPPVQTMQPAAAPVTQTINTPQAPMPQIPVPAPAPAPGPVKVGPQTAVSPVIPENTAQLNLEKAPAVQTDTNLIISTLEQEKKADDFSKLEAEFNNDLSQASQNPSVIENIMANTEKMKAAVLAENNVELIGPAKLTDEGLLSFERSVEIPNNNKVYFNLLIINVLLFSVVGFVIFLWKKLRVKKITTLLDELRS